MSPQGEAICNCVIQWGQSFISIIIARNKHEQTQKYLRAVAKISKTFSPLTLKRRRKNQMLPKQARIIWNNNLSSLLYITHEWLTEGKLT